MISDPQVSEREKLWQNLNMLYRRHAAISKTGFGYLSNPGNFKDKSIFEYAEAKYRKLRELEEHIFRIQTQLGCAPTVVRAFDGTDFKEEKE